MFKEHPQQSAIKVKNNGHRAHMYTSAW